MICILAELTEQKPETLVFSCKLRDIFQNEKKEKSDIKSGLPFMVTNLEYKFQIFA
jgi:hypothetical protein